jgi:DNA-binding NtrC family response regulator
MASSERSGVSILRPCINHRARAVNPLFTGLTRRPIRDHDTSHIVVTSGDQEATPTVLAIDDEPSMRLVLDRLLRLHGFQPLQASAAAEAIVIAELEIVHAFIIDLKLGHGRSGLDVLDWVRLQRRYTLTPVFILTGDLDIAEADQARIREHRAYVFHKGQSLQLLMEYLRRLLIEPNQD